jgi:hypothetical protein
LRRHKALIFGKNVLYVLKMSKSPASEALPAGSVFFRG